MFKGAEIVPELLTRAEELLEELRAESPLRHRLSVELTELRNLGAPVKKKRRPAPARA